MNSYDQNSYASAFRAFLCIFTARTRVFQSKISNERMPAALSIFRAILDKRPYRNFGFKWFAHPLSKFLLPSRACARNADMQISLAPP